MKKLNFFALMGLFSTVSFAMKKEYYQADFLKGIENQFDNTTGNFSGTKISDDVGLNTVKAQLDIIKAKSYNAKNGIDAVIDEYNDLLNNIVIFEKDLKTLLGETTDLSKKIKDQDDLMNNLKDISYESEVRAQDDFNFIKQLHDKKLIENSAFEEVHALLNNTMQFKAAEKEKTTLEKEFHDKNQEKAKKEAELLDANNKKMALENLKSAYVRLYATFDDFRTQASTKPAADLEYFALTANNHNGTYIQSGTNAKSVTRLKGIYDEIHTLQGGITRVGNAKKNFPMNPYAYQYSNGYWNELEPHVTQNAVYGNATEKEFQKNVYATVFEYVDKIESTVQAQPGSGGNPGSNTENEKLILKLNLKHDLILKNNDFLKTFINKDGGREDLHMHILYTDMANRFNLNVNYSFDGSSIVGSMGAYDAYINPGCYYIHDNGYTYYNNHYYDGYGILQNNPYQWYYFQIYQNYLTPTIDSLKNALK